MIKILKSKKGSALLFVLIAISVLSMLGVSLLSLAVSGLKLKIAEKNIKEGQYMSESGLDQAYVLASEVVKEAISLGKEKIDEYIEKDIDAIDANVDNCLEKYIEEERNKERDDSTKDDSKLIEGTSGKGEVDESALKEHFNMKFKSIFKDYVDSNLTAAILNNYEEMPGESGKPEISYNDKSYVKYGSDPNNNVSQITLESRYSHNNATKILAVDFVIAAPDYDQEYTIETVSEVKNPLLRKILAADGNIIVKGSDVAIKGDVYAGGNSANAENFGLTIGDEASGSQGKLHVEGRIFTSGDIRINSDYSELEAMGDIYCSNIRIMDVSSGKVKIGTSSEKYNVHTLNGIMVDGTNSSVDIHGKFYGFSKGDDIDEIKNMTMRSTIVINDQYASDTGTHINITGEATDNDKFPDGRTEKPPGNVIAGSNFVPFGLTNTAESDGQLYNVLYQTGESIAIIGNYQAYSRGLERMYPNPPYNYDYNKDNIIFELISENGAVPATKFKNDGDGNERPFGGALPELVVLNRGTADEVRYKLYKGIEDKSMYFKYAYEETPEDEKKSFRFDSVKGIKNIIFSMGSYPWLNEETGKIEVLEPKRLDDTHNVLGLLPKFRQEYQYYINEMGDPDIDYENAGEERKSVSDFIDESVTIANTTQTYAQVHNEMFYKGESNLVIGSDAVTSEEAPSGPGTEKYAVSRIDRGIIYTEGDIYITGQLEFTGTIISKGDIIIIGDGKKVINNVEGETGFDVADTVFKDFVNVSSTGIGDIFKLSVLSKSTEFKGSSGSTGNLYINFKEIIDTKNWRRIR